MPAIAVEKRIDKKEAYRRRIRAAGDEQVLFQLPVETVRFLDELKQHRGLPNRSQALLLIINQTRSNTQTMH